MSDGVYAAGCVQGVAAGESWGNGAWVGREDLPGVMSGAIVWVAMAL